MIFRSILLALFEMYVMAVCMLPLKGASHVQDECSVQEERD